MRWIDIATEDALSESVALRLISDMPGLQPGLTIRKQGNGYLRSKLGAFCEMARSHPVLLITDLDTALCPVALMRNWFGARRKPEGLLFRIAVKEIESWLLSDHAAMIELLGKRAAPGLSDAPDDLPDPKAHLLRLAERAPRSIRRDLCPVPGASQGIGYNALLCDFVRTAWNPARASKRSESLRRAHRRLLEMAA